MGSALMKYGSRLADLARGNEGRATAIVGAVLAEALYGSRNPGHPEFAQLVTYTLRSGVDILVLGSQSSRRMLQSSVGRLLPSSQSTRRSLEETASE